MDNFPRRPAACLRLFFNGLPEKNHGGTAIFLLYRLDRQA
jgi:hypothetical protein